VPIEHLADILFLHENSSAQTIQPPSVVCNYSTALIQLMDDNTVVWSPFMVKDIDEIERVQRRFTKCLRGYSNYSYEERLRHLQLQSLELTRLLTD